MAPRRVQSTVAPTASRTTTIGAATPTNRSGVNPPGDSRQRRRNARHRCVSDDARTSHGMKHVPTDTVVHENTVEGPRIDDNTRATALRPQKRKKNGQRKGRAPTLVCAFSNGARDRELKKLKILTTINNYYISYINNY